MRMKLQATEMKLSPAQQRTHGGVRWLADFAPAIQITGSTGVGKTTLLHHLSQCMDGHLISVSDLLEAMQGQHPLAFEETLGRLIIDALLKHNRVLVDDVDLLHRVGN